MQSPLRAGPRRATPPSLVITALCVALLVGCGTKKRQAGVVEAPPTDPAVLELLDELGDGALISAVIRPGQIPAIGEALAPLLGQLGREGAEVQALLGSPDGWMKLALAGEASGWDPSAPFGLALFQPATDGPPGSASAQMPMDELLGAGDAQGLLARIGPGFRHRALIPATDPAALAQVIRARATALGAKARGETLQLDGMVSLALFPEDGRLRIEAASHGAPPQDWAITGGPSPRTPAVSAFANRDNPAASVLVRPWLLRPVYTQYGGFQVVQAMAFGSPEYRAMLAARGWSILLLGEGLMSDAGAEFDDWAASLHVVPGGLEVRSVASLTPAGAKALERGGQRAPLKLKVDAPVQFALGTDLRAAVEAAAEPMAFTRARRMRDVARALSECGPGCSFHAASRQPLGTLKGLSRFLTAEASFAGGEIRAAQIVLTAFGPRGPEGAAAWQVPKGADLSSVRAAIADLPRQSGFAIEMFVEPMADDHQAVMIGVNIDPRTVFEAAPDPEAGFGRFSAKSAVAQGPIPKEVQRILDQVQQLEARSVVGRRALAGVVRVGIGGSIEPPKVPTPMNSRWDSPIGHAADSAGAKCLARVATGLSQAFDALSSASPEMRGRLFDAALAELQADFECAEAEAALAPSVKAIRRTAVLTMLAMEDDPFDPQAVVRRLEPLCAAGDDFACAEKTRRAALPTVSLTEAKGPLCPDWRPASSGPALIVTAKEARLDGQPLADDAAWDTALMQAGLSGDSIRIGVAPGVRFEALAPIIARLGAKRAKSSFVIETPEGLRGLSLAIPWREAPAERARPTQPADDVPGRSPDRFRELLGGGALGQIAAADPEPGPQLAIGALDLRLSNVGAPIDAPTEAERIRALRALYPVATLYLAPDPSTPWSRVVEVAAAACGDLMLGSSPTRGAGGPPPETVGGVLGLGAAGDHRAFEALNEAGLRELAEQRGVLGALNAEPSAPLTKELIRRVMRRHQARFRYCYEKQLARNPELGGSLEARIVIQPDGSIGSAQITEDTLGDGKVKTCVLRALKRIKFPAAPSETTVTWPLKFAAN